MFSKAALVQIHRCAGPGTSRGFAALSGDVATGLNLLKKGTDPALHSNDEYPEWLWGLSEQEKTLAEFKRVKESELSHEEMKRYIKLENRDNIRKSNNSKAK